MRRRLAISIHILIAPVPWFALSSVMPTPQVFLKFWLPVLLWMAVIFTASADSHSYEHSSRFFEPLLHWLFPNMPQTKVDFLHHIFRKCAHLTEYAILALLLWRALHVSKNKLPAWSWPKVGGTLLLVFLYASSDEFHQSFVPTRTPLFSDVLIDTTGGAIGLLVLWFIQHFRKRPQKKES
jgi:VanZ family protein